MVASAPLPEPESPPLRTAAAIKSGTAPIRDASDRDRAAVDPEHRAVAAASLDGRLRAVAADGDAAVDGDIFGVGRRRDADCGAGSVVGCRLDRRVSR